MKGVVFNLLEVVVTRAHGADTWDDLLDAAGASGAYTSLGNYEDAELESLVACAASTLSLSREDVLRWFGRNAIPVLVELYPEFFKDHRSARPFVSGVNDIIHAEVRKLYAGAACPHFGIRETPDGRLSMNYRSSRRMCALAQGFIEGAADLYCEVVEIEHAACISKGDPCCEFNIRWLQGEDRARAA
jgi:hypothetical protein